MSVTVENGRVRIQTDDPVLLRWLRDPTGKRPAPREIAAAAERSTNAFAAANGLVRGTPLSMTRGKFDHEKPAFISPSDIKAIAAAVAEAGAVVPQLLDQADAWRYCGISRSGWFRLRSSDDLPEPVAVAGVGLRWRRGDLDKWLLRLKPRR